MVGSTWKGGGLEYVAIWGKPITKYLAPGTVSDLYLHYQSTRQLWGAVAVSQLDIICLLLCWTWLLVVLSNLSKEPVTEAALFFDYGEIKVVKLEQRND